MDDTLRATFELAALKKHLDRSIYRIEQPTGGGFRAVMLPSIQNGAVHPGPTYDFGSWKDTKAFLMLAFRKLERPSRDNLLDVQVGEKQRIVVSSLDNYNPVSAPAEEPYPVPDHLRKLVLSNQGTRGVDQGVTILSPSKDLPYYHEIRWLVEKFAKDSGLEERLGITDFGDLTPRQAIDLTTHTLLRLTKYNSDNAEQTDKMNTLDLLQEGLKNHTDVNWKGQGVCRHYAAAMQSIFDSIKAGQGRFSRLHNTYCHLQFDYDSAHGSTYDPQRRKGMLTLDDLRKNREGHAWNRFVTITQDGDADVTIADITWADRNSAGRDKIRNVDYTEIRIEPLIQMIASGYLKKEDLQNSKSLQSILQYYARVIDNPRSDQAAKAAFASKAISLLLTTGTPSHLPPGFTKAVYDQYAKMIDKIESLELETLHKLSEKDPFLDFDTLLSGYVRKKARINSNGVFDASGLSFSRSDNLQRSIFEKLKSLPNFQEAIEKTPVLYKRMIDVYPVMDRDFSPATNILHAPILHMLVKRSPALQTINDRSSFLEAYPSESSIPDAQAIAHLIDQARRELSDLNPAEYDRTAKELSDYRLLTNYTVLRQQLEPASAKAPHRSGPSSQMP